MATQGYEFKVEAVGKLWGVALHVNGCRRHYVLQPQADESYARDFAARAQEQPALTFPELVKASGLKIVWVSDESFEVRLADGSVAASGNMHRIYNIVCGVAGYEQVKETVSEGLTRTAYQKVAGFDPFDYCYPERLYQQVKNFDPCV